MVSREVGSDEGGRNSRARDDGQVTRAGGKAHRSENCEGTGSSIGTHPAVSIVAILWGTEAPAVSLVHARQNAGPNARRRRAQCGARGAEP